MPSELNTNSSQRNKQNNSNKEEIFLKKFLNSLNVSSSSNILDQGIG